MTYNIPLEPEVDARLRELAAQAGQDPGTFLKELIAEKLTPGAGRQTDSSKDDWCARLADWIASFPDISHFVDDSRESIYAGRGE